MRLIDADALIAQMEADAEHIEEPIAKMFAYAAINDVKHASTIEERKTGDLISRQAAIDALKSQLSDWNDNYNIPVRKSIENIERLPSAPPEITLEYAIDYLHSIGWMQEHDLILTEFAQPEHIKCRDCTYAEFKPGATIHCKELGADLYQWDYCSYAERNDDE